MSTPQNPGSSPDPGAAHAPYYGPWTAGPPTGTPGADPNAEFDAVDPASLGDHVPVSPLLPDDPPRIGAFWLDARLHASPAGTAFTAHRPAGPSAEGSTGEDEPAMLLLLSEGAAADAAARDRLAGEVNDMHIDTVLARGGQGQDAGRLAKRFVAPDTPVAPDARPDAPWVALAYDGSPDAADEAQRVLDQVELAAVEPLGRPAGPDYQLPWIDKVRPGLSRLWPLPWPGRYDRAGWRTILASWLLMLLLAALAVLIAILIFRNQPPQSPPSPADGTGSPPPASASPSPGSGSPSPSGSGSGSASPSPSGTGSQSASPSPGGQTPGESGSPGSPTPPSRL